MSEHKINQDVSTNNVEDKNTSKENMILYTVNGREDFVDEEGFFRIKFQPIERAKLNPYVHAIKYQNRYLVKLDENGKLFNPYGPFTEGMETKQRVGRPTWKFRNTNRNNFNQYVNFLKTKNEVFLKNAEREMI